VYLLKPLGLETGISGVSGNENKVEYIDQCKDYVSCCFHGLVWICDTSWWWMDELLGRSVVTGL
jgi:hypothetical protein